MLAVSTRDMCDSSVVPGWRDRYPEGGRKGRTLHGCLCCSHSCTPVGLGKVVSEDFPPAGRALGNQRRKVSVLYSHHT